MPARNHVAIVAGLLAALHFGMANLTQAHPHHAHSVAQQGSVEQPAPNFFFDTADHLVEATVFENPLRYDGDVASLAGRLWYAWLQFTPDKGDQVWVGRRDNGTWQALHRATSRHGEYANPTLTADARGRLWLSYEARRGDQWDVLAVTLADGKPDGQAMRVSDGPGSDIHHRVAADGQGHLWFVWQSDSGGQFDVLARRLAGGHLQEPFVVGASPGGDWHPAVAIDSAGVVHVAWDAYDGDRFNVHLRSRRGGRWGGVVDVARSAAFEGRAQLAADDKGRVWIAWEQGGENWGKPYRGIRTEGISDAVGPLHRFRHIRLALLEADGSLGLLGDPLPMPSATLAAQRTNTSRGIKQTGAFYERSRIAVDAAGRLWVVYRHYYTPWLGVKHRSHVEEGWGAYARCYSASGWSPLYRFSVGQGDGMQRMELVPHQDGVAAVWTTGRTHRTKNKRPRGVVTATLTAAGAAVDRPPLQAVAATKKVAASGRPPRGEAVRVGEASYQLFYGDLHRHTDLSLCRVPIDGTIDDAYRYGIEVSRLDFLGITDHSRDIAQGDALSQLWWRSRKEVFRHQLGDTFIPFYAYERSHSPADHNVISLRGDMLRPHTYPLPQFWQELDRDTITIPHQPMARNVWDYQNDQLRPVLEIFQGCRDNSIEAHAHRGLDKGYHLGFIASSDHMSTSASYACVWAEEADRQSIFRAIQARRTYGATANIRLLVRAGDHWMGEKFSAGQMPELSLEAVGTAPIRTVNLIVDGKTHETISLGGQRVVLKRQLDLQGAHYVYFHLVQSDGNEAWSSPFLVDIGPGR